MKKNDSFAYIDGDLLEKDLSLEKAHARPAEQNTIEQIKKEFSEIVSYINIPLEELDIAYVIGSYSRGKAVEPLSDVDILTFSSSLLHIETMLEWHGRLVTFFVYTMDELDHALADPGLMLWYKPSLRDAIPIHEKSDVCARITSKLDKAEQNHREAVKNCHLPLVNVRRLIEYRRKIYAEFHRSGGANDIAKMQIVDASRKFIENYLMLKYFLKGEFIESESSFFDIITTFSSDIRNKIEYCMGFQFDKESLLGAVEEIMKDICDDVGEKRKNLTVHCDERD